MLKFYKIQIPDFKADIRQITKPNRQKSLMKILGHGEKVKTKVIWASHKVTSACQNNPARINARKEKDRRIEKEIRG